MQFDHFGVVVKNTNEAMKRFSRLFGFVVEEIQTFPDQGFQSTMVIKDSVRIELIEPVGEEGIIQKFIQKNGYGLHHISLQFDDLENQLSALHENGAQLLSHIPALITDLCEISFLHPASTEGVLTELIHRKQA